MQTTAIRTVANPLPENEVILLTLLISKRYIPLYRFTEIFCIIDEFDKNLDVEMRKKSRRRVKWVTAKNTGTRKEGSPGAR